MNEPFVGDKAPKTGVGRSNHAKPVKHVENQLCPEREGAWHLLRMNADGVVCCPFCVKTWAELDLELNGERR